MNKTSQFFSYSSRLFHSTLLFGVFTLMVAPVVFGQSTSPSTVGKPASEQTGATSAQPTASVVTTSIDPSAISTATRPRATRPPNALESLRNAKVIFVRSSSVFVGQSVIESKLRKRKEFQQLGLMITRDPVAADLILEVKHDVLTKYVFTAIDPWTNVVVASGKLSSLGGTVAGKVAKRFMQQVMKARTQPGP